MTLVLIALKSLLVLGVALLTARMRLLSSSLRHLVLAIAILSLPLLLLAGSVPQNFFAIPAPDMSNMLGTLEVPFELPEIDIMGAAGTPASSSLPVAAVIAAAYAGIAAILGFVWLWRILSAAVWVRRTRILPSQDLPPRVSLRQSDHVGSPVTWGVLRPVIVVPADWTSWPRAKQQAVLAHEDAHVVRLDTLTSLVSGLVCCLFWLNPLVWLAHRRLLIEAEQACDDRVINLGASPEMYATQLLEIARNQRLWAAPAMAATPTLPERIHALLDADTRRSPMSAKQTGFIAAAALAVLVPLASINAQNADVEDLFSSDGDILPIVKVSPVYPPAAVRRRQEGYVLVEFTVTETGFVADVLVVDAEPPEVFDSAALAAVSRYKYKPRVENGVAVASPGIRNRIIFALAQTSERQAIPALDTAEISAATYEDLEQAQAFIDTGDLPGALEQLDGLTSRTADLNDNEIAQLHNMRGFVFFSLDRIPEAVAEYTQVLEQGNSLPTGLRQTTLYTLAQLEFVEEEFESALMYVAAWAEGTDGDNPIPYIFMGQVHYQLMDYPAAIEQLERGISLAIERDTTVKENWWALLNYLYFEEENWEKVISILQTLQEEYPDDKYTKRLNGVKAMLADREAQAS